MILPVSKLQLAKGTQRFLNTIKRYGAIIRTAQTLHGSLWSCSCFGLRTLFKSQPPNQGTMITPSTIRHQDRPRDRTPFLKALLLSETLSTFWKTNATKKGHIFKYEINKRIKFKNQSIWEKWEGNDTLFIDGVMSFFFFPVGTRGALKHSIPAMSKHRDKH